MVGSMDSLDLCAQLTVTEKNAISLDCWQDICLSSIWIPSHLLPSRSKPPNSRITEGIFHTLEKKDPAKYIGSFSVYINSDVEKEQEEIFLSDSDEEILGVDTTSFEKIETLSENALPTNDLLSVNNICSTDIEKLIKIDNLNGNFKVEGKNLDQKVNFKNVRTSFSDEMCHNSKEKSSSFFLNSEEKLMISRRKQTEEGNIAIKNVSSNSITESQKSVASFNKVHECKRNNSIEDGDVFIKWKKSADSFISLNETLDITPEINLKNFACDFKNGNFDFPNAEETQNLNSKRNKKDKKMKKKALKYITLDKFLEGAVDISQEDYCRKYFQKTLSEKYKNTNSLPLSSKVEFPNLSEDCKFIHSDKTLKENDLTSCVNKSKEINKNQNMSDCKETENSIITSTEKYGKIAIENIPVGISKDDIFLILCGYGEIKKFSVISTGKFLKAFVEIDLICDIDWIIECLNGSEPFGASSEKIKCYKHQ